MIKTVYDEALEAFGQERQVRKFCEELAELQEAVLKTLEQKDIPSHVADEMADVEIMMTQMRRLLGISDLEFTQWQFKKIEALRERIGR